MIPVVLTLTDAAVMVMIIPLILLMIMIIISFSDCTSNLFIFFNEFSTSLQFVQLSPVENMSEIISRWIFVLFCFYLYSRLMFAFEYEFLFCFVLFCFFFWASFSCNHYKRGSFKLASTQFLYLCWKIIWVKKRRRKKN